MNWNKATKKVSCYLASGWFNDFQEECRQDIINALNTAEITYFSPKDEVIVSQNADTAEQKHVFRTDLESILNCDFIIVNTAGKDLGTIFEAGYAFAYNKPIIYYFKAPKNVNFNIMLAQSGVAVAQNPEELANILNILKENNFDYSKLPVYKGVVE